MRRRTPSEIKAYGDGYTEAYKEFCHLLKNHDVDKAMRKMKIFADAVVLTVETATSEPQTEMEKSGSRAVLTARCLNCHNAKDCKENHWEVCRYEPWKLTAVEDEQQTEQGKCPFDDPIPCEWVNCPNSTDCSWK